jgi:hypothetical protein
MLLAEFSRQGDFEADARGVLRAHRTVKNNHDNCKNASNRSLKWSSRSRTPITHHASPLRTCKQHAYGQAKAFNEHAEHEPRVASG